MLALTQIAWEWKENACHCQPYKIIIIVITPHPRFGHYGSLWVILPIKIDTQWDTKYIIWWIHETSAKKLEHTPSPSSPFSTDMQLRNNMNTEQDKTNFLSKVIRELQNLCHFVYSVFLCFFCIYIYFVLLYGTQVQVCQTSTSVWHTQLCPLFSPSPPLMQVWWLLPCESSELVEAYNLRFINCKIISSYTQDPGSDTFYNSYYFLMTHRNSRM